MEKITLKLTTLTIPVELETPTGNQNYEIRELSALQRGKHMDEMRQRMEFNSEGKPITVKKFDGMLVDLLSRCMFRENGTPVPASEIQQWPQSTVQALYDAAHKLNRLGKEDAKPGDEAKNE